MSDSRRDCVSNGAPNSVPAEEISPLGLGPLGAQTIAADLAQYLSH